MPRFTNSSSATSPRNSGRRTAPNNQGPVMPRIRGGMGIINPKTNRPGTIGLIATQGASRYLVSCYHVLCRLDRAAFQKGEEIYLAEDAIQAVPIARTEQGLADLDAAAALVVDNVEALAGIIGFPPLAEPVEPEEGMKVVKLGHATGKTEGQILRVEADEVWIEPLTGAAGGPNRRGGGLGKRRGGGKFSGAGVSSTKHQSTGTHPPRAPGF